MTLAVRLLRAVVGAAFVAAGAGKLFDESGTRVAPILLGAAPGPVAIAASIVEDSLPWLELLCGVATWAAAGRIARCVLGVGLGGLFVGVAAAMPEGVRCGCFGALGDFESRAVHVAVAAGLAIGVAVLFWLERKALQTLDLGASRRNPVPEAT